MEPEDFAKRIRDACLEALLQAYEDAGVQGLCAEGRWEAAVGALRTVELAPLLREFKNPPADWTGGARSWLIRTGTKIRCKRSKADRFSDRAIAPQSDLAEKSAINY